MKEKEKTENVTDQKNKGLSTKQLMFGGAALIILVVWLFSPSSPSSPDNKQSNAQQNSGVIEIDSNEWRGVTCLDSTRRVDGSILTDEVWWEVRLDKDDRTIHQLYPRHMKPGSHWEIPNEFNVMEWRVSPNPTLNPPGTKARIAWSISPRR